MHTDTLRIVFPKVFRLSGLVENDHSLPPPPPGTWGSWLKKKKLASQIFPEKKTGRPKKLKKTGQKLANLASQNTPEKNWQTQIKKKLAKNWRIEVKSKIRRKTLCVRSDRIEN